MSREPQGRTADCPAQHRIPAKIEIEHLTKRFVTESGEPFTAIRDVSLTVEPGEFCAIVGPDRVRQVHDARPGVGPRTAQRRLGAGRRPRGPRHHRGRQLHVPGRRAVPVEDACWATS